MASDNKAAGAIGVLVMVVLAAIIASVVTWVVRGPDEPPGPALPAQGCLVTVDGFTTALSWEQAGNAAIIVGEAMNRGLPARAATIALVTAYQESDLHNLDYGDLDSVGLFQQRPSQGWGTEEQIMDPWYSAGRFYDHLVQVPDWESGVINDIAQAVQRSGHPEAYAQHEQKGRSWASALTGFSPATVSCVDRTESPADRAVISQFVNRVYGDRVTLTPVETAVGLDAADETVMWSAAQMIMLLGAQVGLDAVQVAEQQWVNSPTEYATWQPVAAGAAPVVLTLRAAA